MKISHSLLVSTAVLAIALSGAVANANPSEPYPSPSGFVDKVVTQPSCDDPALTFSGRYVGPGANLRLEREIVIEEGVTAWIAAANEGVAVYRNGRAVSGFGRSVEEGHVTVYEGDTFEVSQYAADEPTGTFRLQVLMPNNPEFTEFGDSIAEFPLFDSCVQIENAEVSAAS